MVKLETRKISTSVPISNNRDVLSHICDIQMDAFEKGNKSLTQSMITELSDIFGKYNRGMRLEFLQKIWVVEYKGLVYNIFVNIPGKLISVQKRISSGPSLISR